MTLSRKGYGRLSVTVKRLLPIFGVCILAVIFHIILLVIGWEFFSRLIMFGLNLFLNLLI